MKIPDRWAECTVVDGNRIRQLAVPSCLTRLETDDSGDWLVSSYGRWQLVHGTQSGRDDRQLLIQNGDETTLCWIGPNLPLSDPAEVLESLHGRFRFVEDSLNGSRRGLRTPQLGAVHAVLGYWATAPTLPATVVMPTGTGKTDTMNALFTAARLDRLLVIVPTDALRTQLAGKLETYGVLPVVGALDEPVLRPVVGTIEHAFTSAASAIAFAERCNIIVATVSALAASAEPVRRALVDECSHLFVDEAHHIAAAQWEQIRDYFHDRYVVQFTATPFRADGKHLGGRLIFAFSLREAQRQGYFSRIDYIPVTDFADPDLAIARTAAERLRKDLANGLDHLLMARAKTKARADEIVEIYTRIAADLNPVKIHSGETKRQRLTRLKSVEQRASRIIVCVDMLGEGYDLPALKIAAIHDAHKSLPVTLQFIGRFARVGDGTLGDACAVVNRPDPEYDENLRQLYADDADWNLVIRELAEAAVGAEDRISEFEAGFGSTLPDAVPIRSLEPKLSTVVYRTRCTDWTPEAAANLFGEDRLLTSSIAVNRQRNLAWFVSVERAEVRWGTIKSVEDVRHDLYVLYWDNDKNLLYVNSSNTDSVHKTIAEAACGTDAEIIKGETVYRVMAKVNRLVPTNVGLIDVRSRARRFSMHVGADVVEGFPTAEAQTKSKTNIFANGYENGFRVGFGGSLKGRVWSAKTVKSLSEWADWCDRVGAKITDESVSVDEVMKDFIRPQIVRERPYLVILAVDWPYELYFNTSDETTLTYKGEPYPLLDAELRVTGHSNAGPIAFDVTTPNWSAPYEVTFTADGIAYRPLDSEVHVVAPRSEHPLSHLLVDKGLKFYFEDETTIEHGGFLLRPPRNTPPFRADKLVVMDWTGTDIKKESQGPARDPDSIQYRVIRQVCKERDWDVVIDDDGSGEAADIVGLAVDDEGLLVRLVHCKYSSEVLPGGRVADLYEVCGQAHKSVQWKRAPNLIDHLIRRERQRQVRHGRSGLHVGNDIALRSLQHRARRLRVRMEISIAQPGLSASKVSDAQLQLLACTEVYVHETALAKFNVLCSA
ncbi:DEAD/DEAH box helicase [Polymorphospora rubra]|uniref:DEAD/DEAH box helicase n=1 Tax=Polymorphospora rubra TaxID=338584 RepID=UPI0033C76955